MSLMVVYPTEKWQTYLKGKSSEGGSMYSFSNSHPLGKQTFLFAPPSKLDSFYICYLLHYKSLSIGKC